MMYLPIVLMLGILGLLIFIARRRTTTTRPVFFYGNRIKWLVLGYVCLLLLSVGIYFLIPSSNTIYSEKWSHEPVPDLYLYASGAQPLTDISSYLKQTKEFEYQLDELNIETFGYSDEILIRVEKNEQLEGVVEASYYETPTIVQGIDVSEKNPPLKFGLSGESLEVHLQEHVDIHVTAYKNEFPFIQFINQHLYYENPAKILFPQKMLHLRVPENVKVNGADFLNLFLVE